MQFRVGRITLALVLIAAGAVLVYDNLTGTALAGLFFRLWPAVMIMLGIEWVVAASLSEQRVQTDGGAIALLIIAAIIMGTVGAAYNSFRTFRSWDFSFVSPTVPGFFSQVVSPTIASTETPVVDGLEQLVLDSGSASVQVEPGDALRMDLEVRAHGRDQEEAEQNARLVKLDVTAGATTMAVLRVPSGISLQSLLIRVTLPSDVDLTVESISGSVQVRDMAAPVAVKSSSGSIRLERVAGAVDLQSSSGSIHAYQITGDARVVSSSGSIRLEQVDGRLDASSSSGSINVVGVTGQVSAQASSGSVTVESDQMGGPYDLGAVSGSIRLVLPASAGMTVDARSSSGTVSGPSWLTLGEGRGSGTGSQGDGAHRVTIRTTSGSISLTTH